MLDKINLMHPLMSALLVVFFVANIILAQKAFKLFEKAYQSDYWPRINAMVIDVMLQKVVLKRDSATSIQQHYEVIYNTHYHVGGRTYRKHLIIPALSKEQAEAMRADKSIELTYNPDKPEEAFMQMPEKHPLFLMIFGILLFNAFGVGLAKSISQYLA